MKEPDWEGAYQYVIERLLHELPSDLYYHGVHHTREDVLPAATQLGLLTGLDTEQLLLLRTAALYHDTGFLVQYRDNEGLAVILAGQTLPRFGYAPEQIAAIQAMIWATRMPQQPENLLQALMCDADMDSLGRADYLAVSQNLRRELRARGVHVPLKDWLIQQIEFLSQHTYFTAAARSLREAGKLQNLDQLRRLLADL